MARIEDDDLPGWEPPGGFGTADIVIDEIVPEWAPAGDFDRMTNVRDGRLTTWPGSSWVHVRPADTGEVLRVETINSSYMRIWKEPMTFWETWRWRLWLSRVRWRGLVWAARGWIAGRLIGLAYRIDDPDR